MARKQKLDEFDRQAENEGRALKDFNANYAIKQAGIKQKKICNGHVNLRK